MSETWEWFVLTLALGLVWPVVAHRVLKLIDAFFYAFFGAIFRLLYGRSK